MGAVRAPGVGQGLEPKTLLFMAGALDGGGAAGAVGAVRAVRAVRGAVGAVRGGREDEKWLIRPELKRFRAWG